MRSDLNYFDHAISNFPDDALDFLRPPHRGDLKEKFSIYANGYPLRTQTAMEEVFELLPKLLGEKEWHHLGGAYVRLRPSTSYSLNHIDESLPEFLSQMEVAHRWIVVANFELKIWHSFHAYQKESTLRSDDLAHIDMGTRFLFQDSMFLFESKWNAAETWKGRNSRPVLKNRKEYSLIFRDRDAVIVEIVEKNSFEFLTLLKTGFTLGEALDKNVMTAENLSKTLHHLISKEIIYGI